MSTTDLLSEGLRYAASHPNEVTHSFKGTRYGTHAAWLSSSVSSRLSFLQEDVDLARGILMTLPDKIASKYIISEGVVPDSLSSDSSPTVDGDESKYKTQGDTPDLQRLRKTPMSKINEFISSESKYADTIQSAAYLMSLRLDLVKAFTDAIRNESAYAKFYRAFKPYFVLPVRVSGNMVDAITQFQRDVADFNGKPLSVARLNTYGYARAFGLGLEEVLCLGRLMNAFDHIRMYRLYGGAGITVSAVVERRTYPVITGQFRVLCESGVASLDPHYRDFAKLNKANMSTLVAYFTELTTPEDID